MENTIARKNLVGFLVPGDLNHHILTTHVVICINEKRCIHVFLKKL
jgi:hypothetical protein